MAGAVLLMNDGVLLLTERLNSSDLLGSPGGTLELSASLPSGYSVYLLPLGTGAWREGIPTLQEAVAVEEGAKRMGHRVFLEGESADAQALYHAYLWDAEHCVRKGVTFSWEVFQAKWESGELHGKKPSIHD
jgi:hypothetical protein